ncbi:MAG: metallophosphoesterase [Paludibacter sp.]|nr:metallophosphoesterase [Paludibacter sp.]
MKKYHFIFFLLLIQFTFAAFATKPFRFALFSDTHISPTNSHPTEDLQHAVNDVNSLKNIDFVLVSGDVSNLGDTVSLKIARKLLQNLKMPYYVIPGNHDIKWNEPNAGNFKKIFRDDKFIFGHNGFEFIGFTTAPLTKSSNGIILQTDIDWMKKVLEKTGKSKPVFVVTHYPLLPGDVDNGKDMIDVLQKFNVKAVLNGHYHRNVLLNYDGIPGIVNRSTLRGNNAIGGYSLYTISDSIIVSEKRIGQPEEVWLALPLELNK